MSESFGGRTRRGFGYLAALRLLGLLLQVLLLRLVGNALPERELTAYLLGIPLLALSGVLGTAGFLPPLLRRMAQEGESTAFARSIGPACRRGATAGILFLAMALTFDIAPLPALALALMHLLLPLHLAAAPELLHGRTRLLARAEFLARLTTVAAFAALALADTQVAWPWLLCWWMGTLLPSLLLWGQLGLGQRPRLRLIHHLRNDAPASRPPHAERLVALGDVLRLAWMEGIHPVLRLMVGPMGYLGFGAAIRVHRVGMILPAALATTVQGPLSKGNEAGQRRQLLRILPVWMILGLIGTGLGLLLAPMILEFLFPRLSGSSQVAALASLRLLMATWPALFGAGLCLPFLLARGRERQVAIVSAIALALCFTVFFALLQGLGPVSAAWALLWTEYFVFLATFALVLSPRSCRVDSAKRLHP